MSNTQRNTAVIGFGKSGKGTLDFLLDKRKGENLFLYNDTPIDNPAEQKHYEELGVTFLLGEALFRKLEEMNEIIVSPGVDARADRFKGIREKNVKIIAEIELGYSFIQSPIIGVTGTNGKSTTVSLIHHLLKHSGANSYLAGNIGLPFISEVDHIASQKNAVVVLELSSFQLEEIIHFKPHVGLILNITPDHLDRYKSMEDYFSAKLNIVMNQSSEDYLVLNADDTYLKETAEKNPSRFGPAKQIWFSNKGKSKGVHLWIESNAVHFDNNGVEEIISLAENPLRGSHNLENIMAAVAAVRMMGVSVSDIEKSLPHFKGLSHRMESVGKIGNVEFINDSKATNVDAALKSISSLPAPMIVILGGKDKGSDFRLLSPSISTGVEKVLLVGKAAGIIRSQLEMDGLKDKLIDITDLNDAVEKGIQLLGEKGGIVLLAPGCASFDMFKNFEHRGDVFREAVANYKEKKV